MSISTAGTLTNHGQLPAVSPLFPSTAPAKVNSFIKGTTATANPIIRLSGTTAFSLTITAHYGMIVI